MDAVKRYRILIVDDSRTYLKVLRFQLTDLVGNSIDYLDEAWNGRMAIVMASQKNYNLVFMDIDMPVMDGIDATRILKVNQPYLKIIALSMYSNIEYVNSMLSAGADQYIIKDALDEVTLERILTDIK
jgi:two-component system, NarL family, response regulator NreC